MHGGMSKPAMGPYPPRDALALRTSPNQSATDQRRWGSTPCGAVSIRENILFVHGVLDFVAICGVL